MDSLLNPNAALILIGRLLCGLNTDIAFWARIPSGTFTVLPNSASSPPTTMAPFAYSDLAPSKLLPLHRYRKLRTGDWLSVWNPAYIANYRIDRAASQSALEILSFFTIGCAIALSHHFYYSHLSYKSVERTYSTPIHHFSNQRWASRIGSALAFAANFFFAKAVGAAYVQRLWTVARRTGGLSLDGLNAGFDVLYNLQGFLSLDLISSAQGLILLALMSWAMPLIVIITPSALLVVPRNVTTFVSPCTVPLVDLSTLPSSAAICLYNTITTVGLPIPQTFQYLESPSPQAQNLATLALLSGTYTVPESACGPICDYTTSFFAPYFNCTKPFNIGKPKTYFNGTYFWYATSVVNSTDAPDQLYIDWFGDRQAVILGGQLNAAQDLAQRVICSATNASYTLYIQHNGSYTSVTPQSITPVNNFTTVYDVAGRVLLTNPDNTEPMVYSSIFLAVTSILDGTVLNGSTLETSSMKCIDRESSICKSELSPAFDYSQWLEASLTTSMSSVQTNQTMVTMGNFGFMNTTAREWIPFSDIGQKVESLMLNISIGLMALNIQGSSSKQISTTPASASAISCTQHTTENAYLYRPMVLWVPYFTAVICTLFSILVGLHAIWRNPSKGSTGFKTMLVVTRNSDLTFISAGGGESVDGRVRLRFADYEPDGTTPRGVFDVVPESTMSNKDWEL